MSRAKPQKEKRNERERKRVHQVNVGFDRLRDTVQRVNNNKKMSKADTLREATRYIQYLHSVLQSNGQQPIKSECELDHQMMYHQSDIHLHHSYSPPSSSSYSPPPCPTQYNQQSYPIPYLSHNLGSQS